jgi:hypothetical protein
LQVIRKKLSFSKLFSFFDFSRGDYRFFAGERFWFEFQCSVYFVYLLCGFTALADDDLLIVIIVHCSGHDFLGVHYPYDIPPFVVDIFLFELMAYGIYCPISQQSQVKVCHRSLICFMVDGAKVKVGF